MDADCFDALARALAAARSRSSLARLLGGLSLGGILGTHTARQAAAALFNGGAPCTKGSECKTGKCLGSGRCSCSKAVLAGGSDGGRFRTFRTCQAVASPCPTPPRARSALRAIPPASQRAVRPLDPVA